MLMEILLLFLILVALFCVKNSRTVKNLPPGPSPILPILGNLLQLISYKAETTYQTFDKLVSDYGPVVYIKFGSFGQVIVQDLALAKEVLCSEVWADRLWDERLAERSWGKPLGIIFTWGDMWKEMRRFTMRTLRDFGFGKQKSMEGVIEEEITLLIDSMDVFATNGQELTMRQHFTVSILNILWSMVAGFRFSHNDAKLKQLINLIDETSKNNPAKAEIIQAFPYLWRFVKRTDKMAKRKVFIDALHKFFEEILATRRTEGSYKEGSPKDFIDAFLQQIDAHEKDKVEPNFYTDQQFIMVTYDLFVAGAETSSNSLEFAMLYMALNPQVQAKVQQEIDTVVGENKRPSLEDRAKMPYTEATLLEIQRKANVLPIIARGCNQDTSIAGYHIPQGTIVGISVISLHNCKKTWGDPENFRPERFLDSSNNIIHANRLLSFGLGKRVCLGEVLAKASLFTYFSSILQRYNLTPSPNHPTPSIKPVNGFTLSPQEYFLVLKQRQ